MILSVNHFILQTNLSYWQNGFFLVGSCCWLLKLFVGSSFSINTQQTDWLFGCFDIYERLFNGYQNVEMWHKHNCKHVSGYAHTHTRAREHIMPADFRFCANRFYLTFLWKLFEWIWCGCLRVRVCEHVSQLVHKFCAQLNLLKRNVCGLATQW